MSILKNIDFTTYTRENPGHGQIVICMLILGRYSHYTLVIVDVCMSLLVSLEYKHYDASHVELGVVLFFLRWLDDETGSVYDRKMIGKQHT
jgi:hypothetical protein